MAQTLLESSALSAFCGSFATMLAAGIQTDEAALMLAENREPSRFQDVCASVYDQVVKGSSLSAAMKQSGGFPEYAVSMVATGEASGYLEQVLRNLELYYDEEDSMFDKLRSAVDYPATLLCIMTVILAFTTLVILPVFSNVYANMTGSLATGTATGVHVANAVGWGALALTAVGAVIALYLSVSSRSESGRQRVMSLFSRLPFTKGAMGQLALSRFTSALATHVSSGVTNEVAMEKALDAVDDPTLRPKLERALASMIDLDNPRSLTQAIAESDIMEPLYARMLNVGMRSGSADEVLSQLSSVFFDDAVLRIDRTLSNIEPAMGAFLTVVVGATLLAAMLPLIGIMSAIG